MAKITRSDKGRYRKAFWKVYISKLSFDKVFVQLEGGLE